jgi:hypothetical protein
VRISTEGGGADISDVMMSESSGPAVLDRSNRRRWLISAAVVLLIHACVAVAILTWRHMTAAPVLVDLTPAPSASSQSGTLPAPEQIAPQQTAPEQNRQSASASAPVDDHAAPPQPTEPAAPNGSAASAEPNTGPAEASAGTNAQPLRLAPPSTEAESGSGGTAMNSAVSGPLASNPAPAGAAPPRASPNSPMANMPLDTSITVQPPLHGSAGVGPFGHGEVGPLASREVGPDAAPFDQKPTSVFRAAKPFGVPDVPRNSLLPNGNPGAGLARAIRGSQTAKNSIGVSGLAVPNTALRNGGLTNGVVANGIANSMTTIASRGDANVNAGNGETRNAIGITANFRPRIPRAAGGEAKTAPIVNGRDLIRPLGGPGVIGGPARRAGTGALNGSDFHLRRP